MSLTFEQRCAIERDHDGVNMLPLDEAAKILGPSADAFDLVALAGDLNRAKENAAKEREEIASFAKRVRLPFSGAIAALYSRLDAWKRERVERGAQAAFERGWA